MIPAHFVAIAIGFILDRFIGDPPHWPHPVRWIGKAITFLTKLLNQGSFRTLKGAIMLFILTSFVFGLVFTLVIASYELHLFLGIAVEAVLIAVGLAQKSLRDAALQVYDPLANNELVEARQKLSWIVGRDTERLNAREISRATVETVSENIADGVTAPLFWAFLFGAPGLWLYKTVNTLDSMVGYRDERYQKFGKFSARADDFLNFVPARITGVLLICLTPNQGGIDFRSRFNQWMRDARRHASPNSGFLEAATAWQLGIQLGGPATYRGVRTEGKVIGPVGKTVRKEHIQQVIGQLHLVSLLFWALFTTIGVMLSALT